MEESSDEDSGLIFRKILIEVPFKVNKKNCETGWESRQLTHIQWTSWPDHGVPSIDEYPTIYTIIYHMLNHYITKDSKILLHCSAGIGRTGTLISIFNLLISFLKFFPEYNETAKKGGDISCYKLSVFAVVRRLREQRWAMVNTTEQYELIYKVVSDFIAEKIELANLN